MLAGDLQQQAYLKASNTNPADFFGWSVAISGDTVVVGADREDSGATGVNGDDSDNSATNAGAVYVFTRNGNQWCQQAYLKASNSDAGDRFGMSVAISGDTVVVGAPDEDSDAIGVNGDENDNSSLNAGAAYVFIRDGSEWRQQAYLKASNSNAIDRFGTTVAVAGDTLVVGAALEDSGAAGVNGSEVDNSEENAGAAYVFTRNGTVWSQQAYLKAPNSDAGDLFGNAVSIYGNTIVAGAVGEDSAATGVNGDENNDLEENSGAAYVFIREGAQWSPQAYLKASNAGSGDMFGNSVAISRDTVVIGANGEASGASGVNGDENDNSAPNAGAAYVFTRNGTMWRQQAYLKASNSEAGDDFGFPVAISGEDAVIGGYREDSGASGVNGDEGDNSATSAGATYAFTRSGELWRQRGYLKASNAGAIDGFGHSAAISNSTVVVGALFEDSSAIGVDGNEEDNSVEDAGAAYVMGFAQAFTINAGLNDAWFNPATPGQGFLISVFPDIGQKFVTWATFDTERPPVGMNANLGDPGHRWLTALGPYAGDVANLTLFRTQGGVFDAPFPAASTDPAGDGTLKIEFADCNVALATYNIISAQVSGEIPIERIRRDNVPLCDALLSH